MIRQKSRWNIKKNINTLIISITDVSIYINKELFENAINLGSTLYGNKRFDIFPDDFLNNTSLFEGKNRFTISLYFSGLFLLSKYSHM